MNNSVWKPLFGPLLDWPLVFCRPSSLKPDDIELMDNVFPNVIEESINLHYSEQQDWCFLDKQMDTEVVIFQGGDSDLGIHVGTYMLFRPCCHRRPNKY